MYEDNIINIVKKFGTMHYISLYQQVNLLMKRQEFESLLKKLESDKKICIKDEVVYISPMV